MQIICFTNLLQDYYEYICCMILLFFVLLFFSPAFTTAHTARELQNEFSINISDENPNIPSTETVILNDDQDVYPLGLYLEILEDPSCKLTINEITSQEFENRFVPSNNKAPNFGYTNSAYWVRFRIRNEANQTENWRLKLDFADMQNIDFYMQTPDSEEFIHKITGTYLPFKTRDIPYLKFVFKIHVKYGNEHLIYMRFENGASMTIPLSLSTVDEFTRHSNNEQLFSGLFYGILFLILGYSLIILIFIVDRSYFYFIFSIAGFLLFHASYDGFASQYLWPEHPFFNHFAVTFFGALFIIFSLKITDEFLQTKSLFPVFHKFINGWLVFWVLAIISIFFLSNGMVTRLMTVFALICPLSVLLFCFVVWYRNYLPVRFYIFAWLLFLISGSTTELVRLDIVHSNTYTEHGFQIGALLFFFLLFLKKEKDRVSREQTSLLQSEITDRAKALKESEEKYRNVVERANDMITIVQDNKIKYVNQKVTNVLGQKVTNVLGYPLSVFQDESFEKFVHPDEYGVLKERNMQRLSGKKVSDTYESVLVNSKGDKINVIISGGLIEYEGKPGNLAIIHNITDRKKNEIELKRNEEKYRGFFKTSTDCVYITSKDGKWLDMSDSAPGFFGYKNKEELKKVNIRDLYKNPTDRGLDISKIEQKGFTKDVLFKLKKKDGSIIIALISSVAIKDSDGNIIAFQGSIRDITAQKEAEKTLKENQKYLQELNASKDKFFSIISHDLRSPFNAILGFTELLWKNSEDFSRAEIGKIAYDIYKTGSETIDLLNNLLEWSSSQTGKLKMYPKNFILKSVVEDTIDLLNEYAKRKNIIVLNEVPGQIKVFADKNMISSVIRNLLSNAIKFTQNGSVRITAKEKYRFMEFSITDTGVGIKPRINSM